MMKNIYNLGDYDDDDNNNNNNNNNNNGDNDGSHAKMMTIIGPWKGWSSVHRPVFKKANVQSPLFRKVNVHFSHSANVPVKFSEMECPFLCTSNLSLANHIVVVPKT